jgi:hypothetical protein
MTRRMLITLILMLAIIAVAVVIVLVSSGNGTTTSSTATNPNESVTKVDHQDPNQSGCSATGMDVVGTRVPVIAPNGSRRGELLLRRSTACQAIWGEVVGLEGHSRYFVEVDIYRPNGRAQELFHDADMATYVFGNMLSERPGCVYATAYLQQGERRGPVARTPCR